MAFDIHGDLLVNHDASGLVFSDAENADAWAWTSNPVDLEDYQ